MSVVNAQIDLKWEQAKPEYVLITRAGKCRTFSAMRSIVSYKYQVRTSYKCSRPLIALPLTTILSMTKSTPPSRFVISVVQRQRQKTAVQQGM